jgi:hypothetical protein
MNRRNFLAMLGVAPVAAAAELKDPTKPQLPTDRARFVENRLPPAGYHTRTQPPAGPLTEADYTIDYRRQTVKVRVPCDMNAFYSCMMRELDKLESMDDPCFIRALTPTQYAFMVGWGFADDESRSMMRGGSWTEHAGAYQRVILIGAIQPNEPITFQWDDGPETLLPYTGEQEFVTLQPLEAVYLRVAAPFGPTTSGQLVAGHSYSCEFPPEARYATNVYMPLNTLASHSECVNGDLWPSPLSLHLG